MDLQETYKNQIVTSIQETQKYVITNKIVNISLMGGLIGILLGSPAGALNDKIQSENSKGWKVVQIIPASSGNIFLFIWRLILLLITFFLFTTTNGYYIVFERSTESVAMNAKPKENSFQPPIIEKEIFCPHCKNIISNQHENCPACMKRIAGRKCRSVDCEKCGHRESDFSIKFCSNCGNKF